MANRDFVTDAGMKFFAVLGRGSLEIVYLFFLILSIVRLGSGKFKFFFGGNQTLWEIKQLKLLIKCIVFLL